MRVPGGRLPGVVRSPNIWDFPQVYEAENRGVDPDGVIEAAMRRIRPWSGATLLDLGCGSGFHLPRFAAEARTVVGVEPHPPLVALATRRTRTLANVRVTPGSAEAIPLPDASVDVVHARWAYFFGPGSEPGLREIGRVLRRGGAAFVIDNDATRSTFGGWFKAALPKYDARTVEEFWARNGWNREPLGIRWQMPDRATFEACIRIEFAPDQADRILASHPGTSVDYAVNLFWHTA